MAKQKPVKNPICIQCIEIKKKYDEHAEMPEYMLNGSVSDMRKKQLSLKKNLIGITLSLYKIGKETKENLLKRVETCYVNCTKNIPYER